MHRSPRHENAQPEILLPATRYLPPVSKGPSGPLVT